MDESFRASFSDKLLKYMAVVELATKRQIKFESVSDVGLPGAPAGFRVDPVYLCVGIVSQTSDTTRFERTIAHEITHGLLIYGLGYCFLTGKDSAPDDIFPHLSLLSFIDDIVVNKMIESHGFKPFSPVYLAQTELETRAAQYRDDRLYDSPSYDQLFKSRIMISRYILAWSAVKYYNLDNSSRKIINAFLKEFSTGFPEQYEMANFVRKEILKNDIFTPAGHRKIIETILKQWDLWDYCVVNVPQI
jgi:hypothetical protein